MRFLIPFVATFVVISFAAILPAHARYSLCNKTSYTLSAAVGYVDGDRLATRGWWRLRPGQCKVALAEATNPGRYFVYAEAIQGHLGPLRSWSGETPLCVETSGFFNLRNQEICRDDPGRQRSFMDVEVTAEANGAYQTDFAEPSNYTVYSAEVAGVQRLLGDIGKGPVRIDGSLSRETQRLLAAYRQEKNLGEGAAIDDQTIDALIEEANAREAKLGLFLCNRAEAPVWSAIATPQSAEGAYQSKGWWRLEPGDCAKIVKGALETDHVYVYGATEEARGERRLTGGDRSFCVNAIRFEASSEASCADQELDEAAFVKFETGGAKTATFNFESTMFVQPPAAAPTQ